MIYPLLANEWFVLTMYQSSVSLINKKEWRLVPGSLWGFLLRLKGIDLR